MANFPRYQAQGSTLGLSRMPTLVPVSSENDQGGQNTGSGLNDLSGTHKSSLDEEKKSYECSTVAMKSRHRISEGSMGPAVANPMCQLCTDLYRLIHQISLELTNLLVNLHGTMTENHFKHFANLVVMS